MTIHSQSPAPKWLSAPMLNTLAAQVRRTQISTARCGGNGNTVAALIRRGLLTWDESTSSHIVTDEGLRTVVNHSADSVAAVLAEAKLILDPTTYVEVTPAPEVKTYPWELVSTREINGVMTDVYVAYGDDGAPVSRKEEATPMATHKVGDRVHFTPSPERAPFKSVIGECDVTVIEVIDHGTEPLTGFPPAPRFSYVVQADDGERQGTDDRELTEVTFVGDESLASLAGDLGTDPYTLREFAPDDLRDRADHERLPESVAHVIRDAWAAADERTQTVPSAPTGTGWPGGMVSGRADYAKEPRRFRSAHGKRKEPRGCQARRRGW